jgi:hypothetical protein
METYLAVVQTVIAIATCGAVGVAVCGLRTWRREVNSSVARRVRVATLKLRNVVQAVRERNRFQGTMNPGELKQRWDIWRPRLIDAITELDAAALEAEAAWYQSLKPMLDPIKTYAKDAMLAMLVIAANPDDTDVEFNFTEGEPLSAGDCAFAKPDGENDPFADRFQTAISRLTEVVKRKL